MQIAYYSPLPPAKTGIADYSAALLEQLTRVAEVETIASAKAAKTAKTNHRSVAAIYQFGNNPHHDFVYEAALKCPGVAVLHEANLHHLVVHLTLARGMADAYWREVVLNGGAPGSAPDYKIRMLRTVLARSRAAIVHSTEVENVLRAEGFERPIRRIPHGAWSFDPGEQQRLRAKYRINLGFDESAPVFGIFGFLKSYKRIAQAQRAFRRLAREVPGARLLLVGERHPEVLLDRAPSVKHIDFSPIEDFNGYMAACDVIVNLRYPTVGETSGTLTRAMAMAKPAIVTDTGSFREYPAHTCLCVPPDAAEEELLFEYMKLLALRPDVRDAVGGRARAWIGANCSWESVAAKYADFVADVSGEHLRRWVPAGDAYPETHRMRLETTLAITPPGGPGDAVLEMGAYLHITPALKYRLGYGAVRGCYLGPQGRTDYRTVTGGDGASFTCPIDHFDAERNPFPYDDASFATILCCELLEHLQSDPMHMMTEIHRILKPGGHLVLTTPNVASLRSIGRILLGYHPMLFPAYLPPDRRGEARHAREYTPREISELLAGSGFDVIRLETGPYRQHQQPDSSWVRHLLEKHSLAREHGGECIYIVGRKIAGGEIVGREAARIASRYPDWLYA